MCRMPPTFFAPVYDETQSATAMSVWKFLRPWRSIRQGTLDEARRLWKSVNRPNVMIKVPGTKECVPAIRQLLEEGININITLLFAQSAYEQVAEAYIAALEARAAKGQDISTNRQCCQLLRQPHRYLGRQPSSTKN